MSTEQTAEDSNLWQHYREMEAKLHRREEEIERLKSHYENHQALIEDYSRMWRNQGSTITRLRSLAPRLRFHSDRPNMIAEIADELERLTSDTQGLDAPDWADVREAARNAGWTARRDPDEPRVRIWGRYSKDRMFADWEHGWARAFRTRRVLVVDLAGPDTGGGHETVHLVNPTPARVLAAARLLALGDTS